MLISTSMAENFGIPAIITGMILQAFSVVIYELSYQINFSKVKSMKESGRQLGLMHVIEKITGGLAPMIGGILVMLIGPQQVMLISAGLFALAAIPLLTTKEPIKTNQRIKFKGFPWRNFRRNFIAQIGTGFDTASANIWAIITPIFIFAGQNSYGVVGVLSSLGAVVGILAAIIYGRFADKGNGLKMLQIPVYLKSLVLAIRGAFVFTPAAAVASNLASESTTTGYYMAYYKGGFDAADRSGSRIVYIMILLMSETISAVFASLIALLCLNLFQFEENGMRLFLVISAIGLLMFATADFPLYRRKKRQYREN